MKLDLTDITLVVDRSGSMQDIRSDAEGGVNAFIENQAKEPGEALLTLVQFDTDYEFLHKGVPIGDVPKYELVPRGATALLDAVGRAINETGERLSKMNEADRPGLVVFVVMTDGLENSSQEFSKPRIKEMIQHQQKMYGWQFTFLGADQDAFAEASAMGMDAAGAANFSKHKIAAAYGHTGAKVARMRKQRSQGETVVNEFTPEERQDMN
ncbi:MAG: vWA domain-containing protein [Pirellulaceae bacterium]|jgi:Mg-chelatase subunit ChlD